MNASLKVDSEVPTDYKRRRLDAWQHLSFGWLQYTQRDSFHRKAFDKLVRRIVTTVRKARFKEPSLIDLGCGPGVLLGKIAHRKLFARLVGVDFCPSMINLALTRTVEGNVHVEYFKFDLEDPRQRQKTPLTHSFDIASAAFLFDEVGNINACFQSAAYFLRPGGFLIVATLVPERERIRYASRFKGVASGSSKPVLLSKYMVLNGHRHPVVFFRIIRERQELLDGATHAGFEIVCDQSFTASTLGSRLRGPFLRLLVFRRKT